MNLENALETYDAVYLESGQITYVVKDGGAAGYHVDVWQRFTGKKPDHLSDEYCPQYSDVLAVLTRVGQRPVNALEGWQGIPLTMVVEE